MQSPLRGSPALALQGAECPPPRYTSQSGREHVAGNPVGCQSLLSKQELGLRVINHGPSDSNPGPYLYPKKCRWSPVPSSLKETDSSNKEAPYQISAREPEAARGRCGKGFYKAGTRDAAGGSGGFTRRVGTPLGWAPALVLLSRALSANGAKQSLLLVLGLLPGTGTGDTQSRDECRAGRWAPRAWWACVERTTSSPPQRVGTFQG